MEQGKKSPVKKIIKIVLILLLVAVLVSGGYVAYAMLYYHRLPDYMELEVQDHTTSENVLETNQEYTIASFNIGFGAFVQDFSFWMDGGKYSRAYSKESCMNAIEQNNAILQNMDPDIIMIQEADTKGTRSYQMNQPQVISKAFPDFDYSFAQNMDIPYCVFPLGNPHGKNVSGLLTLSVANISKAERISFPVEDSFGKYFELDRCFMIDTIPVSNGKNLSIINLHMSAYANDPRVHEGQVDLLIRTMEELYAQGNYIICGGDFNHDLTLAEGEIGVASWATAFPRSKMPEQFQFTMDLLSDSERAVMGFTSRDTSKPFEKGNTDEYVLDGLIISDNIEMESFSVFDTEYAFSDHKPVVLKFKLLND